MRTTPAWPLRTTSRSASITRTVRPQPDAHIGHTPGFHVAWPGTMSSSGTNRTSVFSGTAAARQRGGGAADGSELDEGAAIHQKWQVRQSSGACLSLWQFTQKPMLRSTVFCATVCWPIGPWQVSHAISFRMCGAWLNFTCDGAG